MIKSTSTCTVSLTEDELHEAVEYYMNKHYNESIKIKHLKHKERTWTEGGGGMMEMDYSVPDGIEFTCEKVSL